MPSLILAAHRGKGDPPLRRWLAPYSPSTLSTALETVLESDERQKQLGAYSTGADVAAYMARVTILSFLMAGHVLPAEALADSLADNRDLMTLFHDWLSSAPRSPVRSLLDRLDSLTVLDPTCGTGPFLIAALHLLEQLHRDLKERLGRPVSLTAIRRRIMEQNLFGIDLSPEAVALCRSRLRLEAGAKGEARDNLHVANVLLDSAPDIPRVDIILGNPPYLELRGVDYTPNGFRCQESGTVHSLCVERSLDLLRPDGWMAMLVPMSLVSTQRMRCVQELIEDGRNTWYANFAWRPARLFPGVHRAITLFLATGSDRPRTWSTGYLKWRSRERPQLFDHFRFVEVPRDRPSFWVPKLSDNSERPLLEKTLSIPTCVENFLTPTNSDSGRIYYRTDGGLYWKVFTDFAPRFSCDGRSASSTRETWITAANPAHVHSLIAILSSDLFWWWYTVTSNCRHLNPIDVQRFPLPASALDDEELARLGRAYLRDITRHSVSRVRVQKQTGRTETQTFRIRESRPLLLRIGMALARHYRLTAKERDYLANYDKSYRMSADR